jgi:hypothetical protein
VTIGELLKVIGGPNNECDMDAEVFIIVSSPGTVGGTPKVALKSAGWGMVVHCPRFNMGWLLTIQKRKFALSAADSEWR